MTSMAPSARLRATVAMVESTSWLRSSTGTAATSGGRLSLTRASCRAAACATVRLFSPASIRAVPSTASCPSRLAPPRRGAWPISTLATSATRTVSPARLTTGA
ncbi:hypothetical protein D3C71_1688560 [compost metagenome]